MPIRTDRGWLSIYHAADENQRYCLGAMLTDLDQPERIIGCSDEPILQPEAPYETQGFFGNVVFTCGAVAENDGTVKIYWGAGDTVMCAGTAVIQELVELCLTDSRPPM